MVSQKGLKTLSYTAPGVRMTEERGSLNVAQKDGVHLRLGKWEDFCTSFQVRKAQ